MSNCIIFALRRWWSKGGYVVVGKSPRGWWPHFLWTKDLITFEEYIAKRPKHGLLSPPPLFRGRVRIRKPGEKKK